MESSTFEQHLLKVLRAHPAGLSEHDLIKILEAEGQSEFDSDCLRENLSLFQTHFFLFHSLYKLRDQLWEQKQARLDISALCIQLLPVSKNCAAELAGHDPLREYYLNLENLENTDIKDVEELLTSFWERFITNDERRDALKELELQDPVDWPTIKNQHRKLAMQHHPDRGGDEERLQAINAAMSILARDSRNSRK